jgi:RNA polymerase sigma factor (sigma-70 family)
MPDRLRKEFDSLDFAQDVWASFCAIPIERREFKSPTALHAFLVKVAENKIIDAYRRRMLSGRHSTACECDIKKNPTSPEPTPSQWAIAGEKWNQLSAELEPSHLAVVEHLRAGYSCQEIAERLETSLRTITRIVDRVQRMCGDKP